MTLHPIQVAIEALHKHVTTLHNATVNLDFDHNDTVWGILVGMLPDVIEAAQDLTSAVFTYLTNR